MKDELILTITSTSFYATDLSSVLFKEVVRIHSISDCTANDWKVMKDYWRFALVLWQQELIGHIENHREQDEGQGEDGNLDWKGELLEWSRFYQRRIRIGLTANHDGKEG